MNLKPIEEGCLAVVIRAKVLENNGKVVRVGKFLGDKPELPFKVYMIHGRCWEIDTPLMSDRGIRLKLAPEYNLLRIDGEEFLSEENVTQEKLSENK